MIDFSYGMSGWQTTLISSINRRPGKGNDVPNTTSQVAIYLEICHYFWTSIEHQSSICLVKWNILINLYICLTNSAVTDSYAIQFKNQCLFVDLMAFVNCISIEREM